MKTKLIQTEDYLLLIDEEAEIKEGDTVYENISGVFAPYEKEDIVENPIKIIAYFPRTKEVKELDLPLLPPFNINVEKLAKEYSKGKSSSDVFREAHEKDFIAGYKAAQSDKQFSLDDMKKAIEMARGGKLSFKFYNEGIVYKHTPEEIIQSLSTQQLPKEFIPEYRYYYHSSKEFYSDAGFVECSKEQYESIKVEIPTCPLKTEIKTITNSEGKEEIVGTYIN